MVVVNPAPFTSSISELIHKNVIDVLILNEIEAESLISATSPPTPTPTLISSSTDTRMNLDFDDKIIASINHLLSLPSSRLSLVIVTLGARGVIAGAKLNKAASTYDQQQQSQQHNYASFCHIQHDPRTGITIWKTPALSNVNVVDTTAAGDTFVGYFVASLMYGSIDDASLGLEEGFKVDGITRALNRAVVASGMACEKEGAACSIPLLEHVLVREHDYLLKKQSLMQ